MATIREAFGFNIRLKRGERTQAEMSEFLDVPLRTYQRFDAGEAIPQGPQMDMITSKLGVSEADLVQLPGRLPKPGLAGLIAEFLAVLPALEQAQLESLLGTAKLFRQVNTLLRSKSGNLADKDR